MRIGDVPNGRLEVGDKRGDSGEETTYGTEEGVGGLREEVCRQVIHSKDVCEQQHKSGRENGEPDVSFSKGLQNFLVVTVGDRWSSIRDDERFPTDVRVRPTTLQLD